ncbi:hypothetical protein A9W98_16095 [Mycobacterium gordonae]|uniref:SSD domain-containing protein n=1 Tax=Mycobacterium gordonae TaxID=1778 RepID=A0A1A6BIY1_MYCGO|nr:RND family transporter [Mycobacterium gordonae]OBS02174.1 hypothetical protein A9W98_16095 [Mycobacterium gordonae]
MTVLGRLVVRAPWLVIGAWLTALAVLIVAFPPLSQVVESRTVQPLPPRAMAAAEQMAKAFGESAQNTLVVVLTDERGLQPADETTYRKLAATLRDDTTDVTAVQDPFSTPALRQVMVSPDHKAFFMAVTLRAPTGSPESSQAYQRVARVAKLATANGPLRADVTGQPAVLGDLSIVTEHDMHLIEIATALLVLTILAVIYRRPATVLLPLVTIAISVASAQRVVSALTQLDLGVSALTTVMMTAVIAGAGTDYAVFLISRYHEHLRSGRESDVAVVDALRSVGKVIAASAATVAVTFFAMVFTRLPAFTCVGPALAVSIVVSFGAAVTLLPAILVLAGRRGWVAPRRPLTDRLWRRSAVQIVRRPKVHLLVSLSILISLAGCVTLLHPTFDDRSQLPASAESNRGFSAMDRHFGASTLLPQYIYLHSPRDLRTPQSLADLEQMAQRVAALPDVAAVRGITRPAGSPLTAAELSFQAGEVGAKLQTVSTEIADRNDDLNALTSGADELAGNLARVRDQVSGAEGSMTALATSLSLAQQQLDEAASLLRTLRDLLNAGPGVAPLAAVMDATGPMLNALNSSAQCDADATCRNGRQQLQHLVATHDSAIADQAVSVVRRLQAALDRLRTLLTEAGGPAGVQRTITHLRDGADSLAGGSRRLAEGVRALVDQTRQMGIGMTQAADLLLSMKRDAAQPSMAGMYIPPQVLGSANFKRAAAMFISPDGHSVRYLVESKFAPFSAAAMDQDSAILNAARSEQHGSTLADASISMAGTTAMYNTTRSYYNGDIRLVVIVTLLVVFLILVTVLRAIVAPLYLIASVVISYLSAVGLGVAFFQFVCHQAIYWNVSAIAFIMLVAVGADYNLLLITRIKEEARFGVRSGIIRAVRSTGGVITSAGLIFAASMFGLLFGSISIMVQTGFVIGMGLLIDTFVVRTITVPALAAMIGTANWWPRLGRKADSAS